MERWCWVNFLCRSVGGRPTVLITVGQGPVALAVGAGGGGDFAILLSSILSPLARGWSAGAMVLGKLPVPRRPTIWVIVGQGPAVGAGGGLFGHFYPPLSFLYSVSLSLGDAGPILTEYCLKGPLNPKQPTNQNPLSPSLWETARYRLKHCLKGPLNPKHSFFFRTT